MQIARRRMNRIRRLGVGLGFGLILGLTASGADNPTSSALPSHAETRANFALLDTSGNLAISLTEWRAATAALFESTDTNRDGYIDQGELGSNVLARETFPSVDGGRDGRLSKREFRAFREVIFRTADIDRNDYITFVEYEILVILRRMGWKDRNRDGRIAISELTAVLTRAFPWLDLNRDEVLTGNELKFLAPAHLEAMDPRRTGRVTLIAMINGYRIGLGADQVNRNIVPRGMPLPR